MAVNVTALFARKTGEGWSLAYEEALASYWGGATGVALDRCASFLAEDPEAPQRFHAYRLWIEILAEDRDSAGLGELAEHLMLRGQADPEDQVTYQALRGLVHFERDEFSAAHLIATTLADFHADSYALELVQLVNARKADELGVPELAQSTVPLTDYFHARSLARGLLVFGDVEGLAGVLKEVAKAFKGSPLSGEFEYHRQVDEEEFAGAAVTAGDLSRRYPKNVEYSFQEGFALYHAGANEQARDCLAKTLQLAGDDDSDVLALLGHCFAKLGESARAVQIFKRAIAARKSEGLPAVREQVAMSAAYEASCAERGEAAEPAVDLPQQKGTWLTYLSPRSYLELLSGSDADIERLVRPMGTAPRSGDLCFFAYQEKHGDGAPLKIAAIYVVASDPVWHPIHGHESALQLVDRPPVAIPVDVALMDEEEEEAAADIVDRDHPYHHGLYELEAGALDIITEAVRQRREDGDAVPTGSIETA